jgi:hypothetical protein
MGKATRTIKTIRIEGWEGDLRVLLNLRALVGTLLECSFYLGGLKSSMIAKVGACWSCSNHR